MQTAGMNGLERLKWLIPLVCFVTVFSLCFVPFIQLSVGFYIRLEDLLLPFVLIILLPYHKALRYWYFLVLILWAFYGILTMAINQRLNAWNDYTEVYKLFKFASYLFLFYLFFKNNKSIFFPVSILFIGLIVFNLFHFTDIFNFNEVVMPTYSTNIAQIDFFGKNSLGGPATKRILGTMGNPNINALLFSFFLVYFITFLERKEWHYGKLLFFLSFAMILFTQSRTAILSFVCIFVFYVILKKLNWKYLVKLITLLILIIFLVKLADDLSLSYISNAKLNIAENGSLRGRLEVWSELWAMIKERPFFGYGINKNYFYSHKLYSENEYILILWRYGFIGLIFYLTMLFGPIIYYKNEVLKKRSEISVFYLLLVVVFGMSALTNNPMSDPVIQLLFAVGTGAFLSQFDLNEKT